MTERYDVMIVGGGAAGLSAALVLARARRRVLVLDSGAARNAAAGHVHGYLSRDGVPPAELLAVGRAEVTGYGATIAGETVRTVAATEDGVTVTLVDGRQHRARRVLVTTGLTDELPDIPGLAGRWGRDVLQCPYCHGWEVREAPIAVVGSGPLSVQQALLLRQWSDRVTLVGHALGELADADRRRLAAREVRVVDGRVHGLVVSADRLTGVRLADGAVVACSVVFIAPRLVANHAVLDALGVDICDTDAGEWIVTDPVGRTNVPRVWAAGNVTDPTAKVITAAADGARAAMAINADLVEDDIDRAIAVPAVALSG